MPQIETYLNSLNRRDARMGLIVLDAVLCGVAPTMSKNGKQLYDQLQSRLKEITEG